MDVCMFLVSTFFNDKINNTTSNKLIASRQKPVPGIGQVGGLWFKFIKRSRLKYKVKFRSRFVMVERMFKMKLVKVDFFFFLSIM